MITSPTGSPRARSIDSVFGDTDDFMPDTEMSQPEVLDLDPEEGIEEAVEPIPEMDESHSPKAGPPANAIGSIPSRPDKPDEYMFLAYTIDSLYREMSGRMSDNSKDWEQCMSLLNGSSRVIESEDYADAGYELQQAEARLLRARLMERPPGIGGFIDVVRRAPAGLLHAIARSFPG